MRVVEKERDRTQVQAVSENAMVSIEVNYAGAKEADQYLKAMNLVALDKQAQRKQNVAK